jgi:protein-disulfide isomerase
MIPTRRELLIGASAVWLACGETSAQAQSANALNLTGDDGKSVVNYRLASDVSASTLPGILWIGATEPSVTLIELFDYNCGFCHRAAGEIDALLAQDKGLRLGLLNNAIIGLGSVQAAKVQQAVLTLYGPQRAYAFHKAMFAHRGENDGLTALDIAKKQKLDVAGLEAAADSDATSEDLIAQVKFARANGFVATPSFILKDIGLLGYPGTHSLQRMIVAARTCGKLLC